MEMTMAEWQTVTANSNLIQHESDHSVLIKLPGSKLKFWHPKKLVRQSGRGGYRITISFTGEWTFKVFRSGEGRFNRREILEEKQLSAAEFAAYFNKPETADEASEDDAS
jgi:hypothetical protein